MVLPSQGPVYILLKDTVGLKRPPRRIGMRIGTQKLFTANAGSIYLANKDDRQPQDKTMISLILLGDPNCILVAPKEQTRLLNTAELNILLPIASDEKRAKTVLSTDFADLVRAQINDIVEIHDGDIQAEAKVKYVGQLSWTKCGVYLGVEFEEPIGDNEGCNLFESRPKHAKFVTADKIEKFIFKTERTHYVSDNIIYRSNSNNSSKIYKRLSLPIAATFAKFGKQKLKSSKSVEDLSVDQVDKSTNEEKEIHYAVSEVTSNNNTGNNKKNTKNYKRKSFPSLSFSKINFPRMRSKSLQDFPDVQATENPYYTQSSVLEESEEGPPPVLCYNQGCDVRMDKDQLEEHEKVCKFAFEKCPNEGCDLNIRRNEINKHDIMECEYAIIKCPNEICKVKVCRNKINQHQAACEFNCEKDSELACDLKESYESMEPAILEKECPAPDCTFKGFGNEVCTHLCNEHCDLLIQNLTKLKELFSINGRSTVDDGNLYSKPIKEKSLERSTDILQEENPIYSPSGENKIAKMEIEHLYLTPCDSFLSHRSDTSEHDSKDEGNIYLTPVDTPTKNEKNSDGGEHIYSTPIVNDIISTPPQGKYQYLCAEFQI